MNHPPFALLATEDEHKAERWREALAARGVVGRVCADRDVLDRWVEDPGSLDAMICESPFATSDDIAAIQKNRPMGEKAPVTVMLVAESEQMMLANSLSAGLDLPIVGESSPGTVADAALVLIERQAQIQETPPTWELDAVAWRIVPPTKTKCVPLTFKEREFLLKLARQPGQPLPKETFVELFGTTAELFDPRRLEIMVRRLRNKVRSITKTELPLHTAHGLGYALATPVKINGVHDGLASCENAGGNQSGES